MSANPHEVQICDSIAINPPIPYAEFTAKAADRYQVQPVPFDPRCEGRLIYTGTVALFWADWDGANYISHIQGPEDHDVHSIAGLGDHLRRIIADYGVAPDGTPRTFTGKLFIEWGVDEHGDAREFTVAIADGEPVTALATPRDLWPPLAELVG